MSALPESVTFALWFNAWRRGAVSLDEARDRIIGDDAAHDLLPARCSSADSTPLILALGRLAAAGPASVALPVPGDLLGLAGPPAFNIEATEAGQAVVIDGGVGLVPVRAGAGVVWRQWPAEGVRQVPDPGEADTLLRQTLTRTAERLADLDVAQWNPRIAEELTALRSPARMVLPPDTSERAERMLTLGSRCALIVALALRDDGAAVTAAEVAARRGALDPLGAAARRALVAATSYAGQR
ncbi:MAG: hypothetical protein QM655_07235 [Nocardioidaceae bacterium]